MTTALKQALNRIEQLERDITDMRNARQTIFYRCTCGRIAERGIICPTNQDGENCEEGR